MKANVLIGNIEQRRISLCLAVQVVAAMLRNEEAAEEKNETRIKSLTDLKNKIIEGIDHAGKMINEVTKTLLKKGDPKPADLPKYEDAGRLYRKPVSIKKDDVINLHQVRSILVDERAKATELVSESSSRYTHLVTEKNEHVKLPGAYNTSLTAFDKAVGDALEAVAKV